MTIPVRFDYESITPQIMDACKADLYYLYAQGYVKDDGMKYQTTDILFSEESPVWGEHWAVLRETFTNSVSNFVSGQYRGKAWCFASFPKIKNIQWDWHTHPNAEYSAVMYLSLPQDVNGNHCFTTEFLQDDGKSLFVEPKLGSWFVFPATAMHRNGFWDYENMNDIRYCVAASLLKNSEQVSHSV